MSEETSLEPKSDSEPIPKPDHTHLPWNVQKKMLQEYALQMVRDAENSGFCVEGVLSIRESNDPSAQVPVVTLGQGSNPSVRLVRLAAAAAGDTDALIDYILRTPKAHLGINQTPSHWVARIRRMFSV